MWLLIFLSDKDSNFKSQQLEKETKGPITDLWKYITPVANSETSDVPEKHFDPVFFSSLPSAPPSYPESNLSPLSSFICS